MVGHGAMTVDDPYADVPHPLRAMDAAGERSRMAAMREELLDLCEREYAQLVRFVMRAGANFEQAEDAVQDAFLAAWRQQATIDGWEQIGNPSAWLRTVALHSYWRPPGAKRRSHADRVITETLVDRLPDAAVQPRGVDHIELSAQAMAVREALLCGVPSAQDHGLFAHPYSARVRSRPP